MLFLMIMVAQFPTKITFLINHKVDCSQSQLWLKSTNKPGISNGGKESTWTKGQKYISNVLSMRSTTWTSMRQLKIVISRTLSPSFIEPSLSVKSWEEDLPIGLERRELMIRRYLANSCFISSTWCYKTGTSHHILKCGARHCSTGMADGQPTPVGEQTLKLSGIHRNLAYIADNITSFS